MTSASAKSAQGSPWRIWCIANVLKHFGHVAVQRQFAHIPGDARLVLLGNFNQIQIVGDADLLGKQKSTLGLKGEGSTTKRMVCIVGFYSEDDDENCKYLVGLGARDFQTNPHCQIVHVRSQ